jgi:putative FmdB family regulatory protein|uniref:Zinc ribbon domain-containing protein n=1 Tax=Desulfobacca acetoxidans TaxID=60893 RepID=A0A7C5ALT5_9BACT
MPIYEYRCSQCRRVSEFLLLSWNAPLTPVCPKCGSPEMERLLSRVRVRLSEETRMERLADPSRWGDLADLDENDPAAMARMMRRLGPHLKEALGEDDAGEIDQAIEEALEAAEQEKGEEAADLNEE